VAHLRELGVLREEAVARVDGVGIGDLGGGEQGVAVEVAGAGRGRTDAHRFVRLLNVQGGGVRRRIDRHRGDPELTAGADQAKRDLAPVGDEDLLEHRWSPSAVGRGGVRD